MATVLTNTFTGSPGAPLKPLTSGKAWSLAPKPRHVTTTVYPSVGSHDRDPHDAWIPVVIDGEETSLRVCTISWDDPGGVTETVIAHCDACAAEDALEA